MQYERGGSKFFSVVTFKEYIVNHDVITDKQRRQIPRCHFLDMEIDKRMNNKKKSINTHTHTVYTN